MGAVVNPSDLRKSRRKAIESLAADLDPASRDEVMRIFDNWKGEESLEQVRKLLGPKVSKRAKSLLDSAR